jgi:hypothetical protein
MNMPDATGGRRVLLSEGGLAWLKSTGSGGFRPKDPAMAAVQPRKSLFFNSLQGPRLETRLHVPFVGV